MSQQAVAIPITEDELKGFPPGALLAVALKHVWRSLPATLEAEQPPPDLLAVVLAMTGEALWQVLPDERVLEFVTEAAYGLPRHVQALLERVRGLSDLADEAEWIEATLSSLLGPAHDLLVRAGGVDLAGAAEVQMRIEVPLLRDRLEEAGGKWDSRMASELFGIPLWAGIADKKAPPAWEDMLVRWDKRMATVEPEWLGRQYHELVLGKGLDRQAPVDFLNDWLASQDVLPATEGGPQEPPSGDEGEQQGTAEGGVPAESAQEEPPVPGGIVTAAADQPSEVDHLGREPLVNTLADMLAAPSQSLPMTIALLGDWGSGKSSVVAQLHRRLNKLAEQDREQFAASGVHKRSHYLFAEFNAWAYEQTDNLRAGLAQEVVKGLTDGLSRWERVVLALTKSARGNSLEFWMTVGGLALAVAGLILGVNLADSDEVEASLKAADMLGGGGVIAFAGYLFLQSWRTGRRLLEHPLATQMATYLKLPDYGEHLGEVPVIKQELRELCEERLAELPNGRLLVVVDDLDRCHPEKVIETLDAIRLVMDLPQVAVIVAIDDRIAFRAVAEHYKELAEDGRRSKEEIARDYLGKIIQLPVNLYEPWPNEVSGFVRDYLFQVEEPAETVAAEAEPHGELETPAQEPLPEVQPRRLTAAAQRLVDEKGLDASVITATGSDGSVTKADVQRYQREVSQDSGGVAVEDGRPEPEPLPETGTVDEASGPQGDEPTSAEQDAAREALMQDTFEERELFAELTAALRLSNPRQLIRLRNSYRLLKGYRHGRGGEMTWKLLAELMHCLFWYEFLYQRRLEDRQHAELVMWLWHEKPHWHKDAEDRGRNPPLVNMARLMWEIFPVETWGKDYRQQMETVAMVVLPNAEMALTLERPRADALLRARTTRDPVDIEPDPWRGGYRPIPGAKSKPGS